MARFRGNPGAARVCARILLLLLAAALPGTGSAARAGGGPEPPVLSGIVLDPLGRVLPGVEVRLAPADRAAPPVATVRTGEDGRFAVRGIRPGIYRLVAIKGGYAVFVERVDTILRRTLELVLHPAARSAGAGRALPDRSWALRLPARDVLEDLEPGAGPPRPGGGPRFALGLAPLSLDAGPGGHGNGVRLAASAAGRNWSGELRHRGARGRDGLLDRDDRLAVSGEGNWGPAHLPLRLRAATWRREARRPAGDGTEARGKTRGRLVGGSLRGRGGAGAWEAFAEWRSLRDDQEGARRSSALLTAAFELRGGTGARGSFRGRAVLRNALRAGAPGPGGALYAAGLAAGSSLPLEALDGTSLELELGNEWAARDAVHLSVAFAGTTVDGAGTRWSGWGRVEWNPGGGWSLGAAGGIAAGGRGGSEPGWSLGIRRDLSSWSWSLRRTRDAGPVPGRRARPVPFLVLSREARLDAWTGGVTTRLGPAGLALYLEGTAGRVEGDALPLLPGDLPLVPVARRARGRLLALAGGVALFEGSTRVGFTWEELEDRSPDRLLAGGGRRWVRREVRLVQRLGALSGPGFACDLLLGYGRARVRDVAGAGSSPDRVALLRRSRVAGGLRVAF